MFLACRRRQYVNPKRFNLFTENAPSHYSSSKLNSIHFNITLSSKLKYCKIFLPFKFSDYSLPRISFQNSQNPDVRDINTAKKFPILLRYPPFARSVRHINMTTQSSSFPGPCLQIADCTTSKVSRE